ncbi:hypothetical protein FACS1894166_10050 [Bacilli bacterium]|nr:hypothetical protein FACS1894166_10050 [Bacilli bacterium]
MRNNRILKAIETGDTSILFEEIFHENEMHSAAIKKIYAAYAQIQSSKKLDILSVDALFDAAQKQKIEQDIQKQTLINAKSKIKTIEVGQPTLFDDNFDLTEKNAKFLVRNEKKIKQEIAEGKAIVVPGKEEVVDDLFDSARRVVAAGKAIQESAKNAQTVLEGITGNKMHNVSHEDTMKMEESFIKNATIIDVGINNPADAGKVYQIHGIPTGVKPSPLNENKPIESEYYKTPLEEHAQELPVISKTEELDYLPDNLESILCEEVEDTPPTIDKNLQTKILNVLESKTEPISNPSEKVPTKKRKLVELFDKAQNGQD